MTEIHIRTVDHLVKMANDIANFFHSEPDHQLAVEGVSSHIKKFWDPRMRRKIVAHLHEQDGEGLNELARESVTRLAELDRAA